MEVAEPTDEPDSLDGPTQMRKRRLRILHLLTGQPLWKTKVGEHFDVSVQTIGRDIDALHRDGLLTYTLTDAEDTSRTHLISYETTATGTDVLEQYRLCTDCGDVVHPATGCVHDYVPISDGSDDDATGERDE